MFALVNRKVVREDKYERLVGEADKASGRLKKIADQAREIERLTNELRSEQERCAKAAFESIRPFLL